MEIIQGYTDRYGKTFEVPNYHFETFEEWQKFPKESVAYSRFEKDDTWSGSDEGIYIQKFDNNTKAFKSHSEIQDFNYKYFLGRYNEHRLVEELLKYQPKINLTEFPLGIVTIEDLMAGQVIPFYEGFINIRDYAPRAKMIELYQLYFDALKIFKELQDNGIIYTDIHSRNLVVKPETNTIKLIDFDDGRIYFDGLSSAVDSMIDNLKNFLNVVNKLNGLTPIVNLDKTNTLDEISEAIQYDAYKRIRIQK